MPRLRIAAALLLAASAVLACKSPEEKLIDRRHELRSTLDALYESYAGVGEVAASSAQAPERGVVGRLFAGMDRANFDEYCLAIGRGERPFALSDKLEAFMKDRGHARTCRKAAAIQLAIERLQRDVGTR